MINRFGFNRLFRWVNALSIIEGNQPSFTVRSHTAKAVPAGRNLAVARRQVTANIAVFESFFQMRRVRRFFPVLHLFLQCMLSGSEPVSRYVSSAGNR